MKKQKVDRKVEFEITELFLVVADKEWTFVGSMQRGKDEDWPKLCYRQGYC